MTVRTAGTPQPVTVDDLRAGGCTEDEITGLSRLRERYPVIEFVDTVREWQRLCFLRWRVQYGDLVRPAHPVNQADAPDLSLSALLAAIAEPES
jgi:hypothetical protein